MELNIVASGGSVKNKITVSDDIFGKAFNEGLIHQVVTAYLAAGRAGTKAQKTRSDVSGGGKKPWRQKGTGRARAGTIRSPLWRSGGVTFAARPRNYAQKVNKKMYRGAISSILSELIRQDRLIIAEAINLEKPKTKMLVEQLNAMKLDKALLVVKEINTHLELAARNIPHIEVCQASQLDPVKLVAYEKILMTVDALKHIEESLA